MQVGKLESRVKKSWGNVICQPWESHFFPVSCVKRTWSRMADWSSASSSASSVRSISASSRMAYYASQQKMILKTEQKFFDIWSDSKSRTKSFLIGPISQRRTPIALDKHPFAFCRVQFFESSSTFDTHCTSCWSWKNNNNWHQKRTLFGKVNPSGKNLIWQNFARSMNEMTRVSQL